MKQRALIFLFLSLSIFLATMQTQASEQAMEASIIPEDAIRFRILANSNSPEDQAVKRKIRDAVRTEIESWVEDYRSVEKAKAVINEQLPDIKAIVARKLAEIGSEQSFSVQFGSFAFPTKLYGNMIYPAGEYDAVLITLGKGRGANWWCVLFPPLCFLNIDSDEAVKEEENQSFAEANPEKEELREEEKQQVEIRFFIIEWLSDLWSNVKKSFAESK